jgi:hypothetical protein
MRKAVLSAKNISTFWIITMMIFEAVPALAVDFEEKALLSLAVVLSKQRED